MTETVVVGGGLAGGAVATLLARAGRQVRVLEREREPVDKVCGEFLSIEAQRYLADLGIDLDRLGASRMTTLRLVSGGRTIETPLPFVARGLTRKRLDAVLLERAEAAGARIDRGVAVRSLAAGRIDTTAGALSPDMLLVATGKHEVRGAARRVDGCETDYVGFKSHWTLNASARRDLAARIDVILFDGGYAGLQMVEGDLANLCLLVTKRRLGELGGRWSQVLDALLREPHARSMLGDATLASPKPLTIAGVPYGYLYPPATPDDAFRLGDQAAVIPSFCGEGMAIALHSAAVAASVIVGGGRAADHHAVLRRDFAPRLRIAMALQRGGKRTWSREAMWTALRLSPGIIDHLIRLTRVPVDRMMLQTLPPARRPLP